MKKFFTLVLTVISATAFGQINTEDSTAQVIAYWSIGDKQNYSVSVNKTKFNGTDTVSDETITYDVDVTVVDSTASSYLVEWFYHNYKISTPNEIVKKLMALSEDMKVLIETDELGAIRGVINWEEVARYLKVTIGKIREEFGQYPMADQMLDQFEGMYTSKQGIEATAIQDAQQFHTFHGGKYLLGEVLEFPLKVPNMYNKDIQLDSKLTLYLDEINPEENNFIIRSSQEVDPVQLTNTTYDYLVSMAKSMGVQSPDRDDIGQLSNVTTTASRIHDSGWVIYSIQTRTVSAKGASSIEERVIEIK